MALFWATLTWKPRLMRAALALRPMVGGSETNNTEFMALNDFPAWYAQFSAPPWSWHGRSVGRATNLIEQFTQIQLNSLLKNLARTKSEYVKIRPTQIDPSSNCGWAWPSSAPAYFHVSFNSDFCFDLILGSIGLCRALMCYSWGRCRFKNYFWVYSCSLTTFFNSDSWIRLCFWVVFDFMGPNV